MKNKEISISMRILHPKLSAEEITAIMKCEPDRAESVGAPRTTPKGQPLDGIYSESFWMKKFNVRKSSLRQAIEKALTLAESVPSATLQLTRGGGRIEFFIGWFIDKNTGDVLPFDLLKKVGDLQIDLSFDVYNGSADKIPS